MNRKYTKEILEPIVRNSTSIVQICKKLGVIVSGGNFYNIVARIKEFNINTTHFTGQGWNKGKTYFRKTNDEIFKINSSSHSWGIRNALFKRGLKEKRCEICDLDKWLENPIPLEVNHKNGIKTDNRLLNLEIRCPNCHYFTDNYKIKNRQRHMVK